MALSRTLLVLLLLAAGAATTTMTTTNADASLTVSLQTEDTGVSLAVRGDMVFVTSLKEPGHGLGMA